MLHESCRVHPCWRDCWRYSQLAISKPVGDQSGLLAIFFRSWRSRRTVGDQSGLLAIKIRSWRSRWTVGDSDGLLVRFNIAKSFVNSALKWLSRHKTTINGTRKQLKFPDHLILRRYSGYYNGWIITGVIPKRTISKAYDAQSLRWKKRTIMVKKRTISHQNVRFKHENVRCLSILPKNDQNVRCISENVRFISENVRCTYQDVRC